MAVPEKSGIFAAVFEKYRCMEMTSALLKFTPQMIMDRFAERKRIKDVIVLTMQF